MPGAGLRQAQPSSGPCGHTCQTSNGPSRSSTRRLTASTWSRFSRPRAIPDWLDTTPTGIPAARSRDRAAGAVGTGVTSSGSAQYGTSTTSVPSRSNERRARERAHRAPPRAVRSAVDGRRARPEMSGVEVRQTRLTQLLLTVTSTTLRDNPPGDTGHRSRRVGPLRTPAAARAHPGAPAHTVCDVHGRAEVCTGAGGQSPSFSAASRVPSTRLRIFWKATSRA